MSALIEAAKAELQALDERRRIITELLAAYEPCQGVPPAASASQPRPAAARPASQDADNAAKAAILQHLRNGPQSPRMLKSLTQLPDRRFRNAIDELEREQRIIGKGETSARRWMLAGQDTALALRGGPA